MTILSRVRGIAVVIAACLLFGVIAGSGPASAAKDYFGRKAAPPATSESQSAAPGILQTFVATIARWQREFNDRLATEIRGYKDSGSLRPALVIIVLSFLYGVFHAAGPGHGKMVTTAYFAANRARALHGIAMGGGIAFVQAVSAILIVSVLAIILGVGATRIVGNVLIFEMVSYALIIALGIYMLYGGVIGRGCAHAHLHDHGSDQDGRDHSHDHDHAAPGPAGSGALETTSWRRMLPTAIAVGVRPCTGAVLVLLFTLANGIYFVGIISAFAMALGVAITISVLGVITIFARNSAGRAAKRRVSVANFGHRAAGFAGGLFVAALGSLLFLAAWERSGFTL